MNSSSVTLLALSAGDTTACEMAVNGPAYRYMHTTAAKKAGTKTGMGPAFIGA